MRVGINGFGRMGRLALRAGWACPELEFVAVNEIAGDADALALLLEFDSLHGRFGEVCGGQPGAIWVGDTALALSQVEAPEEIPWKGHGIDLVLECCGRFRRAAELEAHRAGGAAQVLVSAPVTDIEANDLPQKDPRRARSASQHLIPTSTNSAYAVTQILPELAGKLDSIAVRNPCLNASLVDCVFQLGRDTDVAEVCGVLRAAAAVPPLAGILGVEERPLVSGDFSGDPRSAIVDAPSTRVTDGSLLKVLAWYDNEWGYVKRMIDLAKAIGRASGRV